MTRRSGIRCPHRAVTAITNTRTPQSGAGSDNIDNSRPAIKLKSNQRTRVHIIWHIIIMQIPAVTSHQHQTHPDLLAGCWPTKLHRTLPAQARTLQHSAALCRIHQLHQSITSCSHLSVRLTSPRFSILKWTKVIINFWFISQISTQRLKTIFSLHHSASHKLTEADKTLKRNCGDLNWI